MYNFIGDLLQIMKCKLCKKEKNVIVLGIDSKTRKRIYQCTCLDVETGKKLRFDSSGDPVSGRLSIIKCPECSKGERVVFNGNHAVGLICKNRAEHENRKNHSFVFEEDQITLKQYLKEINPEIYTYLQKLYTAKKRSKNRTLSTDDVEACLELGLNQQLISGIFHVNQSTVSRFIKDRKIICTNGAKYAVIQAGEIEDRLFYTKMKVKRHLIPEFDVEF